MSQKLPVIGFKWVKKLSTIDEDFIKIYDEDSHKGYILEVDSEYPKELYDLHSDLPFLPEKRKLISATSFYVICMIKKAMLFI